MLRLSVTYVLWLNGASHRKSVRRSKWEMAYRESNRHLTDDFRNPKGQDRGPNTVRAQHLALTSR